jgi:hypothetical protein
MIPIAAFMVVLVAIAALGASRQSGLALTFTLPAVPLPPSLLRPVLGSRRAGRSVGTAVLV